MTDTIESLAKRVEAIEVFLRMREPPPRPASEGFGQPSATTDLAFRKMFSGTQPFQREMTGGLNPKDGKVGHR